MKKQNEVHVFDTATLDSAATLLDVVACYARQLATANAKPTLPTNLEQPTLLDCAAAYHRQLAQL